MSRKSPHKGRTRRPAGRKPRKQRTLVMGTLRVIRPGVAYLDCPEGTFNVARRGVREAMSGDTVQATLQVLHGRGGERVAYVQSVLERSCDSFLGTYTVADPLGVVSPLDARICHDFFVLPEDLSARRLGVTDHDVVYARILEYPTRNSAGVVTLERRVGSAEELDVTVEAIIASHGLATEFSDAVRVEAAQVVVDVEGALAKDGLRRDLRDELCVTIDPADARDFDDAVGARRLEGGGFEVSVHIADVTHYLAWDSAIDIEARHRTCSVYLVDRVLPMLPEVLCNDVCSLRPHEDRLAMSVRIMLDAQGRPIASEAFPAVICSSARLSYDEVDDLLAHPESDKMAQDVAEMLRLLDEVARLRGQVRAERGAIDFETVESKAVLDDRGMPVSISVRRRTRATTLVEEAMLLANEAVAAMLAERDLPCAYRVHERPSPEDLADCVPALTELGLVDGALKERLVAGDPHAIAEVLEASKGTSGAFTANALLLRAQKRAIYMPHNEGHYALGAKAYCHFTSPIRRYPDVLVHRALKGLLKGVTESRERSQIEKALPQLCRTCSDQERVADAASRDSQKVKMAAYYKQRIGSTYSGTVVGCERYGLFVMIADTCAEGFIAVRELGNEWFHYSEEHMRLTGESTGKVWRLGQHIAVTVAAADVARGRIDFTLAGRAPAHV